MELPPCSPAAPPPPTAVQPAGSPAHPPGPGSPVALQESQALEGEQQSQLAAHQSKVSELQASKEVALREIQALQGEQH